MELSLNVNYLMKHRPEEPGRTIEDCMRLCAEAGFRVADYTPPVSRDDWEAQTDRAMEAASRYGIVIEQSHAPYNRYEKAPLEDYSRRMQRAMDAAVRMGNRQIVIHADDYALEPDGSYNADHALSQMYEFWAPFVDSAVSRGVEVAVETVFEDRSPADRTRFTSRPEELLAMIDRFGEPRVRCCWDTGHARLAFSREKMGDVMRTLGRRISCTHIHDNYYGKDLHLTPFAGDIDWEEQMRTLKEIGYTGNLTFEFVYGSRPAALLGDFLHTAWHTGCYLHRLFEEHTV